MSARWEGRILLLGELLKCFNRLVETCDGLVDVFERALLFGKLVDAGGDLELDEGDVELRVEVCRSGRERLL